MGVGKAWISGGLRPRARYKLEGNIARADGGERRAPSSCFTDRLKFRAPRRRRIDACFRPRFGACERSSRGCRERALSGARQGPRLRVRRHPPMGFHATRGKGFRRRRKEAQIRYRRLPLGDWQGLAIVEPVRMADRVVGRRQGFQAEGRTADDDIAARGFAALRSSRTRSARAPSLTVKPAVHGPPP
jgi:hypothetical protein